MILRRSWYRFLAYFASALLVSSIGIYWAIGVNVLDPSTLILALIGGGLIGLALGALGISHLKKRIRDQIISKIKGPRLLLYYAFVAFVVMYPEVSNLTCEIGGISQRSECLSLTYGFLIGALCSSMLIEGCWLLWWEQTNGHQLYFE